MNAFTAHSKGAGVSPFETGYVKMTRPSKLFIYVARSHGHELFHVRPDVRPEHLLVLNLKDLKLMQKLCNFLRVP